MSDSIRGVLLDSIGRPISSALVKVYLAGTGTLASLYSDSGLTTPVTNDGLTSPLSESDGSYGPYYTANGRYDVKPDKAGHTFDNTDLADIVVEDVRTSAMTITAVHTFNPPVAGPPFLLGANAQSQKVTGLLAGLVERTVQSIFSAAQIPGQTLYCPYSGWSDTVVGEAYYQQVATRSGTIKTLVAKANLNSLTTAATTITLRKNGAATALTVTIPAGSTAVVTDLANTVSVAQGDLLDFQVAIAAGGSGTGGPYTMSTILVE